MKAVLCKAFGAPEDLVVEVVDDLTAGDGQVRIDVKACAINFPDALMIQDMYQFKPPLPFSPGGEVAGVISQAGAGVEGISIGDRVIGSCGWGGMSEQVVLDAPRIIPMPDEMPFDEAAAFIMTYGTSHHALKDRANIQPGESLLVLGAAGGVGLAAVELGKAMGAKVIAAASSEEKVQVAKDHGAENGFVYPMQPLDRDQQKALSNQIKELTGGEGADVVYDPVGGDYCEPALRATAWEGRFLIVGFPAGIAKIPMNLALLKGCQIIGVFWGAFTARNPVANKANIQELMDLYKAGKIKPFVSSTYDFDNAGAGIRELMDRKAKGKVVVTVGE